MRNRIVLNDDLMKYLFTFFDAKTLKVFGQASKSYKNQFDELIDATKSQIFYVVGNPILIHPVASRIKSTFFSLLNEGGFDMYYKNRVISDDEILDSFNNIKENSIPLFHNESDAINYAVSIQYSSYGSVYYPAIFQAQYLKKISGTLELKSQNDNIKYTEVNKKDVLLLSANLTTYHDGEFEIVENVFKKVIFDSSFNSEKRIIAHNSL